MTETRLGQVPIVASRMQYGVDTTERSLAIASGKTGR